MPLELNKVERAMIQKALRDEADILRALSSGRQKDERDDLLDKAKDYDSLADRLR